MRKLILAGCLMAATVPSSADDFNVVPTNDGTHAWRIDSATGAVSYCEAHGTSTSPTCSPWSSEATTPAPPMPSTPIDGPTGQPTCELGTPAHVPTGYYTGTDSLNGPTLKATLNGIISQNTQKFSYSQVWDQLQYTDEDPCNTNNVILLYTGRSEAKSHRDQGQNDNDSWNREHSWPKSHGFPSSGQTAYTDIHHLRPADRSVNSSRGNKDFGMGGNPQGEAPDTFTTSGTWEPRDAVKGDVARMMFYMATRYEGAGNVPDLELVAGTTSSNEPKLGDLCTLYQWNELDPVDDFERHRNNRIFERQGNRNPYVDHPEWISAIWGTNCPN